MKSLILCVFLLSSSALFAQDRTRLLRSIRDLSYTIEQETYSTQASDRALSETLALLQRGLDKLTNGTGRDVFVECRAFAFPILDRTLPANDALNEAIKLCRPVEALEEMKFLFEKYDRTLPARDAITRATRVADARLVDKLELLRFAFEKYDRTWPATDAADRAVRGVSSIPVTRSPGRVLSCFQSSFPIYDRTLPSSDAMDETIKACR